MASLPEHNTPTRHVATSDVVAVIAAIVLGSVGSWVVGAALETSDVLPPEVVGVIENGVLLFALAVALMRWSERHDWSHSVRFGATIACVYVVLRLVLLGLGV
jgi:hypothetical protein